MMKSFLFSLAITAMLVSACGNINDNQKESKKPADSADVKPIDEKSQTTENPSVDQAVNAYLQLKNALIADNGNDAATAGKQLNVAMRKMDNASLPENQKKVYDDLKDDIKEHADHISNNAQKLAHQREHFDLLSKDMIDLVKVVKPSQTLYKDHCPMYNDHKGADWLSEIKEIKNPYLGKKMPECGVVKEEIKP